MRLAVLLVLVAFAYPSQQVQDMSKPQDKPGYGQTEAPDNQVEYVTGPNVGIVGPTVLGGKGQEVQPSGEDVQPTDKGQRDVSAQGVVYSGYQELPQDESKRLDEAAYAKYATSLNAYQGMKYLPNQGQNQYSRKGLIQNKNPQNVIKIGNAHRPMPQKITYYQSEDPARYSQSVQQEQTYYESQNQEQNQAQLHAQIHAHQLSQSPVRGPQEYQQVGSQSQEQDERTSQEGQTSKSEGSAASQESEGSSEENEAQQPPTKETPAYIPQEYIQYQIAQQDGSIAELQSALQYPGKHQLQLFLPQEASGHVNLQTEQPQATPTDQSHLRPIQNGHAIQYIPTYISQTQTIQKEHPTNHPASPQHPSAAPLIRQPHPTKLPQQITLHNAQHVPSQNPIYRNQPHPQLHSNFQPSQHPASTFTNEPTQYHLLQQSNDANRRPQNVYVQSQSKQNPQPVHKAISKPNLYHQQQGHPTIYRPKSPEPQRLPQHQPEQLTLISQSPPKNTQHRQTHDRPPQPIQSEQAYQTESVNTDDKLGQSLQNHPFTIQNVQKLQTPLHIQNPTPFPLKVVPVQPQFNFPLTHSYELTSDKVALRPLVYPIATPITPVQSEIPYQSLGLQIPTEASKLYNIKFPEYIKALEQHSQSKPFGFSQISYGQKPGSYSYSIFNKHS